MTKPKNYKRYLSVLAILIFVSLLAAYFYVGLADTTNKLALKIGLILGTIVSALTAYNLIRQEWEARVEKDTVTMISRIHSDTQGHPNYFLVDDKSSNRSFSQYEVHYCEYPNELELYIPLIVPGEQNIILSPFVFEFIFEGSSNIEKLIFSKISLQIFSADGRVLLPLKEFSSEAASVTRNTQLSQAPRLNLLLGVDRKYKKMDTLVEIKLEVENKNKAGYIHKDILYAKVRWNNGKVTMVEN